MVAEGKIRQSEGVVYSSIPVSDVPEARAPRSRVAAPAAGPKSILLHVDNSATVRARIQVAEHVAETFGARGRGLYAEISTLMHYPLVATAGAALAAMAQLDEERRDAARAAFQSARTASSRLEWLDCAGAARSDFMRHAWYADLIVLGQPDPGDPATADLPSSLVPGLLIDTGRPTLFLPYSSTGAAIGRRVLVAWNETRESARALSAALPWLHCAQSVHVVSFAEESDRATSSVDRYLNAHGVTPELHRGVARAGNAGDHLLSLAVEVGADLLVMGCYGHSRVREWAIGGASRTILQSMTLPVLMVH